MYDKNEVILFLKEHFPNEDTQLLCNRLGLSLSAVRTLANRNGIHKSREYLEKLHIELMRIKEEKYLASIPEVHLDQLEQNIIVGSILGDGGLALAPRSRNAYYREHYSLKQKEYREWKLNNIHSLQFRIEKECNLKSPSHPVFTELYKQFYINGTKTITEENIKLFNHPISLAALYMDDGSLMISASKTNKAIRVHPTVGIATLCFSKDECEILANHIRSIFSLNFYLCQSTHGKGWTIQISKLKEIYRFYDLILPYCKEIYFMKYKWDLPYRLEQKKQELIEKCGSEYSINISSIDNIPDYYSSKNMEAIYLMKANGITDKYIANFLGRSYWSVVDKIRRMRKEGKI